MVFQNNKKSKRLVRILSLITISFIVTAVVVIFTLSLVSKHVIEKYDVKYTGRNIELGWAYVNPFTGYAHLNDLKIYESDSLPSLTISDSVFFSAKGVSVNIAMLKLLSRTIEISSLKLNQPKGKIIQNKNELNFNDIAKKISTKKTDTIPSNRRFSILKIKIKNGEFHYIEKLIPINYFIKEINIDSDGKHWSSDSIATNFSFVSGPGSGSINGNLKYNLSKKEYYVTIKGKKFELDLLDQYFKELSNYGSLRANIDVDFLSYGNINDTETVTNKGILVINDFHLEKSLDDDYASFKKLDINVIEMNPQNLIYLYDSIIITQLYLKYERYDYLDNFQTMFGEDWAKIAAVQADTTRFNLILKIVDLLKALRKNLPKSDFEFNKIAVKEGIVQYNDYTQNEKFSIEANPLYISADSIFKIRDHVDVYMKTGLHPFGSLSAHLNINPKNKNYFEMKYHLQGLPVSILNPYLITHTSFPLVKGTLELEGNWNVENSNINSNNHLVVIDPRVGKRIRNTDNERIPLPLIVSLISEQGNVIDYQIPITGNLKNPKFRWSDAITDVLRNIFVKTPTTRYQKRVKDIEVEIENSIILKWEMQQTQLHKEQKAFIKEIADHLLKNPDASIEIFPIRYTEKEKEYIGYFEAKKEYFLETNGKNHQLFSSGDSIKVSKMSIKDSLFIEYLNEQVKNVMLFTIQEKCNSYIGQANIDAKLDQLSKVREDIVMRHFKKNGVATRVKIHPIENTRPYNGFSFYKIVYKGQIPSSLIDAHQKMDKLNTQLLRKKHKI